MTEHGHYYMLHKAAQKLSVDMDSLISLAAAGEITLCYLFKGDETMEYLLEEVVDVDASGYASYIPIEGRSYKIKHRELIVIPSSAIERLEESGSFNQNELWNISPLKFSDSTLEDERLNLEHPLSPSLVTQERLVIDIDEFKRIKRIKGFFKKITESNKVLNIQERREVLFQKWFEEQGYENGCQIPFQQNQLWDELHRYSVDKELFKPGMSSDTKKNFFKKLRADNPELSFRFKTGSPSRKNK